MKAAELRPGARLGPGQWTLIDQRLLDAFANATGDHGWLHIDPARAASGPFGTTVASAWLLLSLLAPLAAELLSVEDATMFVYGLGRARFPAPVRQGTSVRAVADIVDCTPRGAGSVLTIDFTVTARNATKPVLVADVLYMLTDSSTESREVR